VATQHNLYTVGSTAIEIMNTHTGSGRDITLQNVNSSGYIYIGNKDVTTTNYGYRLMPNHAISFELESDDEIWVVGSTSNLKLAFISINLENNG